MLFAAWSSLVLVGVSRLWRYANLPGAAAQPGIQWPRSSSLPPPATQSVLVMLAHPHCPCTRASLHELARIMAHASAPLRVYVLFYKPRSLPAGWEKSDLYHQAAAIPGVTVLPDENGREARIFHAATSGQVLLYDARQTLQFSGGITGARGHEGDNAGRQAISALLNGEPPSPRRAPVFGCSLMGTLSPGSR